MTDDRPYDVTMPKLTDSMEEGRIVSWHVKPGDPVAEGDVLAEIETDKAVMDLESFQAGTVIELLEGADAVVAVGTVVARIGSGAAQAPGSAPQAPPGAQGASPAPRTPPRSSPEEDLPPVSPSEAVASRPIPVPGGHPAGEASAASRARKAPERRSTGAPGASPRARRLAAQWGIDPSEVDGTGPGGRVTGDDVLRAVEGRAAPAPRQAPEPLSTPTRPDRADEDLPPVAFDPGEAEEEPVSFYQQASIRRVVASKHVIPHFYLETSVRAEPLLARKAAEKGRTDATVTHLLLHGAAGALADVPEVNRSYDRGRWIRWKVVNLGLAVQTDAGLAVAVLRDAGGKPLAWIAEQARALVARARAGKLRAEERTNSTFTLSNLGAYPVDRFSAIINPPSAMTVAAGAIRQVPVVEGERVVPGQVLTLTLSCDHRVVDGVTAARFAAALKGRLEVET